LLDKQQFPWGRGAMGKGITPLVSVAVDSTIIPLGTPLYIPEYDGIARDSSGTTRHDGCFLAEDRGLAVKGQHVDVFTGHRETTQLWNRLVPSNSGVTVVVDSPHCKRAG
jgi:3D (Asp-Asp-Asp) domain-containing protein